MHLRKLLLRNDSEMNWWNERVREKMSFKKENSTSKITEMKKKNRYGIFIVCVNIVLISCIIVVFVLFGANNNNKLREKNIVDIKNINQSSANISSIFFNNQRVNLYNVIQFITKKELSYNEALSYICDSHSDTKYTYELVGTDCKGFAAVRNGNYFV